MDITVTHLDNSGFAVDTGARFLIFDYFNASPAKGSSGLAAGVIDPGEIADRDVMIFASHRHGDHYSSSIFNLRRGIKNIRYVLSGDIRTREDALIVSPDASYELDGVSIKTFKSTDEGVAFLLNVDGTAIYHAGDLNWWHWDGEPYPWNENMERDYTYEIDKLRGIDIGLAFVPVDPRLGRDLTRGIEYLLKTANVKYAVPMHFWGDHSTVKNALDSIDPRGCTLLPPMKRGDSIKIGV